VGGHVKKEEVRVTLKTTGVYFLLQKLESNEKKRGKASWRTNSRPDTLPKGVSTAGKRAAQEGCTKRCPVLNDYPWAADSGTPGRPKGKFKKRNKKGGGTGQKSERPKCPTPTTPQLPGGKGRGEKRQKKGTERAYDGGTSIARRGPHHLKEGRTTLPDPGKGPSGNKKGRTENRTLW